VVGVEMWKVTPSKSETIWSIDCGGAPEKRSVRIDWMRTFW